MSTTMGFGQGFLPGEHTLPPGAHVIDLKICENCPATFVRERGSSIKYCGQCRSRALMPDFAVDAYRELLPTEAEQRHAHHLPKYDNSLLPREQQRGYTSSGMRTVPKRQPRKNYGDWKVRLRTVLVAQGPLCMEAIQEVIGCSGGPDTAYNIIYSSGIRLQRVGNAPRRVPHGPCPGIFTLRELAGEN